MCCCSSWFLAASQWLGVDRGTLSLSSRTTGPPVVLQIFATSVLPVVMKRSEDDGTKPKTSGYVFVCEVREQVRVEEEAI